MAGAQTIGYTLSHADNVYPQDYLINSAEVVNEADLVGLNSAGHVIVATGLSTGIVKPMGLAFFSDNQVQMQVGDGVSVKCSIAKKGHVRNMTSALCPGLAPGARVYLAQAPNGTTSNYTCVYPASGALIEVGVVDADGKTLLIEVPNVTWDVAGTGGAGIDGLALAGPRAIGQPGLPYLDLLQGNPVIALVGDSTFYAATELWQELVNMAVPGSPLEGVGELQVLNFGNNGMSALVFSTETPTILTATGGSTTTITTATNPGTYAALPSQQLMVTWITGNNAGVSGFIQNITGSGPYTITMLTMANAPSAGDTFQVSPPFTMANVIASNPGLLIYGYGLNDLRLLNTSLTTFEQTMLANVQALAAALPNTAFVLKVPMTPTADDAAGLGYIPTGTSGTGQILYGIIASTGNAIVSGAPNSLVSSTQTMQGLEVTFPSTTATAALQGYVATVAYCVASGSNWFTTFTGPLPAVPTSSDTFNLSGHDNGANTQLAANAGLVARMLREAYRYVSRETGLPLMDCQMMFSGTGVLTNAVNIGMANQIHPAAYWQKVEADYIASWLGAPKQITSSSRAAMIRSSLLSNYPIDYTLDPTGLDDTSVYAVVASGIATAAAASGATTLGVAPPTYSLPLLGLSESFAAQPGDVLRVGNQTYAIPLAVGTTQIYGEAGFALASISLPFAIAASAPVKIYRHRFSGSQIAQVAAGMPVAFPYQRRGYVATSNAGSGFARVTAPGMSVLDPYPLAANLWNQTAIGDLLIFGDNPPTVAISSISIGNAGAGYLITATTPAHGLLSTWNGTQLHASQISGWTGTAGTFYNGPVYLKQLSTTTLGLYTDAGFSTPLLVGTNNSALVVAGSPVIALPYVVASGTPIVSSSNLQFSATQITSAQTGRVYWIGNHHQELPNLQLGSSSVTAAGTAYTLTETLAAVAFGTTSPTLALQPGTYILTANVEFTGGAITDNLQSELYNTTGTAVIGSVENSVGAGSGNLSSQRLFAVVTLSAASTVTVWARNATSVAGTVSNCRMDAIKIG